MHTSSYEKRKTYYRYKVSKQAHSSIKPASHDAIHTSLFFRGIGLSALRKISNELPDSLIKTDIKRDLRTLHKNLGHQEKELELARALQDRLDCMEAKIKSTNLNKEENSLLLKEVQFIQDELNMLYPDFSTVRLSSGDIIDVKGFSDKLWAYNGNPTRLIFNSLNNINKPFIGYIPLLNNPYTDEPFSTEDMITLLIATRNQFNDLPPYPILIRDRSNELLFIADKSIREEIEEDAFAHSKHQVLSLLENSMLKLEELETYHYFSSKTNLPYKEFIKLTSNQLIVAVFEKGAIPQAVHPFININHHSYTSPSSLLRIQEASSLNTRAIEQCKDRFMHLNTVIKNEVIGYLIAIKETINNSPKGSSSIEISVLKVYETLYDTLCHDYGVTKTDAILVQLDSKNKGKLKSFLEDCIKAICLDGKSISFQTISDIIDCQAFNNLIGELENHCIENFLATQAFLRKFPPISDKNFSYEAWLDQISSNRTVSNVLKHYRKKLEDLPYNLNDIEKNTRQILKGCQLVWELREFTRYQFPFEVIFSLNEDHVKQLEAIITGIKISCNNPTIAHFLIERGCQTGLKFFTRIFKEDSGADVLNKLSSIDFLKNLASPTVRNSILSGNQTFQGGMCLSDKGRARLEEAVEQERLTRNAAFFKNHQSHHTRNQSSSRTTIRRRVY